MPYSFCDIKVSKVFQEDDTFNVESENKEVMKFF